MPYKSQAQRGAMHAMADRGEIDEAVVEEYDKASKGKKLPKRVPAKGKKPAKRAALEGMTKAHAKMMKEKGIPLSMHAQMMESKPKAKGKR